MNPNIIYEFYKIWKQLYSQINPKPVNLTEGWRNPSPTINVNVTCNVINNLKFWQRFTTLFVCFFLLLLIVCSSTYIYIFL